jgi:hypothetical protein
MKEPLKRLTLDGDEIGNLEWFCEVGKRIPLTDGGTTGHELLLWSGLDRKQGALQNRKNGTTATGAHGNRGCYPQGRTNSTPPTSSPQGSSSALPIRRRVNIDD